MSEAEGFERSSKSVRRGKARQRRRDRAHSVRAWLSPQVALLVVAFMILMALSNALIGGARGGGTEGPTCVKYNITFSGVGVTTTSTNASLHWSVSQTASVSLAWGNTSTYGFTALNGQGETTGGTSYINFLEPNTKYYYRLSASASCGSSGSYASTFTTQAWPVVDMYSPSAWVNGTVSSPGGNGSRPAGLTVQVGCLNPLLDAQPRYGYTDSSGNYSILVWSPTFQPLTCVPDKLPLIVQLQNYGGTMWKGHWNETIVIWAPQSVNFYLPTNSVSGFIPMTYDFTNSSYVQFTLTTSSTLTTSESYGLSIQGAMDGVAVGGGLSYLTSAWVTTTSSYPGVTGDSYRMQQKFEVTGTEVFSVISRAVNLFPLFFEPSGSISSGPTSVTDWMSRPACDSDPGVVYCIYFQGSSPYSNSMTSGGSYALSSSFQVSVSESLDIPGIGTGSGSIQGSYSTTLTSQTSYTVGFTVSPPSNVCYRFEYVFQGDGSGTQGVVAHVWNLGDQPLSLC